jgi:hypothetical protein
MHFRTNKLGFTPEFLGRVTLVTSVASLLGIGVYNLFLKEVPLRKIFLVTTVLGSALGMTQVLFCAYCSRVVPAICVVKSTLLAYFFQVLLVTGLNRKLGISDEWFSIGDSLIITVLGQV